MIPARDNPFAMCHVEALRFRAPSFHWCDLDQRLAALNYRAAIVGPHGSGKTTLLEELRQRLLQRGRSVLLVRINRDQRVMPNPLWRQVAQALDSKTVVMFDGAEQLGTLAWWKLKRHSGGGGLIVTAHRAGRLPTLVQTSVSPALLIELCYELLPVGHEPPRDRLEALFVEHGGNLRDVFRELYDEFAQHSDQQNRLPSRVPQ